MSVRAADDFPAIRARRSALVLFSGGQDSATCLAWTLDRFDHVETIGFDYGQRHRIELDVRPTILDRLRTEFPQWRERLGPDHVLYLTIPPAPRDFVPGRNLLFLISAAALAYRRGVRDLVIGSCETDAAGFPDCRDDAIKATQLAINLGMQAEFVIHTPLMWLDKAATWRLAEQLGGERFVELIRDETHTCYAGNREHRHPWGYGCGECAACRRRAEGYQVYAL